MNVSDDKNNLIKDEIEKLQVEFEKNVKSDTIREMIQITIIVWLVHFSINAITKPSETAWLNYLNYGVVALTLINIYLTVKGIGNLLTKYYWMGRLNDSKIHVSIVKNLISDFERDVEKLKKEQSDNQASSNVHPIR